MSLISRLTEAAPDFFERWDTYRASQRTFDARLSPRRSIRQQFAEVDFCAHIARLFPYEKQWAIHTDEMGYSPDE